MLFSFLTKRGEGVNQFALIWLEVGPSFLYKLGMTNPENLTMNKNLKAILFDMDGVLVDSMNYHLKSWKELLGSFNVNVSDQFIFEHEGAMSPEIIRELFNKNGRVVNEEKISEIYVIQNSIFLTQYLPRVNLYRDSLPLLVQLKRKGILLGLVTSSRRNLIDQIWKEEELAYFSTIISADDVDRFKPYPTLTSKRYKGLNKSR